MKKKSPRLLRLKKNLWRLKHGRFFMCDKPFKGFREVAQKEGPLSYDKPKGLWYSVGDDWFRFTMGGYTSAIKPYIYELEVDTSNVFKIKTEDELDHFTEVYGTPMLPDLHLLANKDDAVDWHFLSRGYTGIEIAPFIWSRRMELKWYYSWDAASGCIWNKGAFKGAKLLFNLDEEGVGEDR
jgi:hypothetical protein